MTDESRLIVVTRAAPDDSGLLDRLQAAGFDAIACPLQRREPIDEASLARRFDGIEPVAVIVVTSPHAAQAALRALGVDRLSRPVLVAPGAGTAARLQACGLRVHYPAGGGTSEEVLELPALTGERVAGRRVLILAAPGGRTLIARTLRRRGAEVLRLAPYRRRVVQPAEALLGALRSARPTTTLLSSALALRTLADALPAELRERWLAGNFVVSSKRLADRLEGLGASEVRVAGGADASRMLAALDPNPGG